MYFWCIPTFDHGTRCNRQNNSVAIVIISNVYYKPENARCILWAKWKTKSFCLQELMVWRLSKRHTSDAKLPCCLVLFFFLGLGQGVTYCRPNDSTIPLCVLTRTLAAALEGTSAVVCAVVCPQVCSQQRFSVLGLEKVLLEGSMPGLLKSFSR